MSTPARPGVDTAALLRELSALAQDPAGSAARAQPVTPSIPSMRTTPPDAVRAKLFGRR